MSETVPPRLYKYRSVNPFLRDILVNHNLYFTPSKEFNDPFDCAPVVSTSATLAQFKRFQLFLTRQVDPGLSRNDARRFRTRLRNRQDLKPSALGTDAGNRMLQGMLQNELDKTGMFCLSADPGNILMWSHYANSHRGICLQFHGAGFEAYPVNYSMTRPVVNPITNNSGMIDDSVFRKAEFWAYEQEWRMLSRRNVGPLPFNPMFLTGIILGARITAEDEAQVRSWAAEGRLAITWKRATLDSREFRMDIRQEQSLSPL